MKATIANFQNKNTQTISISDAQQVKGGKRTATEMQKNSSRMIHIKTVFGEDICVEW